MRAKEFIVETELDIYGMGNIPDSIDVDHFGLRVQMKPSTFLKLALPLGPSETNPEVEKRMKAGEKIAFPVLFIQIPDSWLTGDLVDSARVVGHEGRNRMAAWIKLKGDDPIQVNLLFRGGLRRKNVTDEWIQRLSSSLISENGRFIFDIFDAETAKE